MRPALSVRIHVPTLMLHPCSLSEAINEEDESAVHCSQVTARCICAPVCGALVFAKQTVSCMIASQMYQGRYYALTQYMYVPSATHCCRITASNRPCGANAFEVPTLVSCTLALRTYSTAQVMISRRCFCVCCTHLNLYHRY